MFSVTLESGFFIGLLQLLDISLSLSSAQLCDWVLFLIISQFQELLSLAKRKRVDAGEQDEPVNKPAASTDSETSDSDDEV